MEDILTIIAMIEKLLLEFVTDISCVSAHIVPEVLIEFGKYSKLKMYVTGKYFYLVVLHECQI